MTTSPPLPLNILVAGIYWSGSGAVVDYLKGHPDCVVPRGEFTDFKRQGRIGSMLEAASGKEARQLARRMWLETALGKLPAAAWKQRKVRTPSELPLKEQVFHNRLKLEYLKQYRAHLAAGGAPSDDSVWNQWLQALGARLAGNHKAVVWNQPIWVGKHEACWPGVFSPYRLVVVHRDPQDQFAEVVRQGKIGKRKSDPAFDDSEQDDIAYVLKGIAAKLEHLKALEQTLPMGHLLTVNFETFVKDHSREAERITRYLGLENRQGNDAPFDPSQSIKNIGIGQEEKIQSMLKPYRPLVDRLYELREQLRE